MIEFILAVVQNTSRVCGTIIWIWIFAIFISGVGYAGAFEREFSEHAAKFGKRVFSHWPWMLIPLFFVILPTPDQLWEIRISIIKYELASPENIKAGKETISRIAKELEQKYLK